MTKSTSILVTALFALGIWSLTQSLPLAGHCEVRGQKPTWQKTVELRNGDRIDVWIQNGWIHAQRMNGSGILVWRVALARADAAHPPKVENHNGVVSITTQDGHYFLRNDTFGLTATFLRLFGEGSVADNAVQFNAETYGLQSPYVRGKTNTFQIAEWEGNGWIYASAGGEALPLVGVLFRLAHSKLYTGHGGVSIGTSGAFYFAKDDYFVYSDGNLLVARLMSDVFFRRRIKDVEGIEGKPAPELSVAKWFNVSQPLSLAKLKGKVVLLDFWGTWCLSCVKQLPVVDELYKKYRDMGLVAIGIHSKFKAENLGAFLKKNKLTMPIAQDSGETEKKYSVHFWSAYFLIDKKGIVRYANLDRVPAEKLIQELLRE